MNGVHDMGGMHGFGPVRPETNEPTFHEEWEGRCLALNRAMGFAGLWNIDQTRAAIENLPPEIYLQASYYERWALRLRNMLVERGLVDLEEMTAGHALRPGKVPSPKLMPADVDKSLTRGAYAREARNSPRYKPGDLVRTRNLNPPTHTRLPRYARGRVGTVETIRGCHVFPDSAAIGEGDNPQWLYTVCFDGQELWGEKSDPRLEVSIEAFEPYLEALRD
ncbi:MAG TPA: nitrile hydratase subunit beta [Casimicrobiaceae bacterium]|nr:nitrile hydratase subunit beta [Casimicrobiaceae bacterium]